MIVIIYYNKQVLFLKENDERERLKMYCFKKKKRLNTCWSCIICTKSVCKQFHVYLCIDCYYYSLNVMINYSDQDESVKGKQTHKRDVILQSFYIILISFYFFFGQFIEIMILHSHHYCIVIYSLPALLWYFSIHYLICFFN